MDLVAELLQSRYEDINAKEEMNTDAMPRSEGHQEVIAK